MKSIPLRYSNKGTATKKNNKLAFKTKAEKGPRKATKHEKNHENEAAAFRLSVKALQATSRVLLLDFVRVSRALLFDLIDRIRWCKPEAIAEFPAMTRYEVRSERGRATICEFRNGVKSEYDFNIRLVTDGAEIWKVKLEPALVEGKTVLVETGAWPIIPPSREEARYA